MRLDIRYRMLFVYDSPVREAHNELRVRPKDTPTQRVLADRLTTDPVCRTLSFTDYWGTRVDHLGVLGQHDVFEIIAEAAVETRDAPDEPDAASTDGDHDGDAPLHNELLDESPHVTWNANIADIARQATAGIDDREAVIAAAVSTTRELLTYEKNSTHIGISLAELVAGGAGVCQDYAHLTIGLLRAVGVPARYVSGYLFAGDETVGASEADGPDISVQTHAWVEAELPGGRWLAVDPTNNRPVDRHHVVIGFGRDYDDVAPVRGIYSGIGRPEVDATVEIRRMEPVARMMSHRPRRDPRPAPYLANSTFTTQQQQQQQQQQTGPR